MPTRKIGVWSYGGIKGKVRVHGNRERLLIVCDETAFRAGLQRGLGETIGWDVESVETSGQAFDRWSGVELDLLLIDESLQGERGVDLVQLIRARDPQVGVVLITRDPSIENAIEMHHLEIDGYIEKPIDDMAETVRCVREIVEKVKARRDAAEGEMVPRVSLPVPGSSDPGVQYSIMLVSPLRSEREWMARQIDEPSRIRQASTTTQALQIIEKTPQDIVVVDATVNDPDVFEFIRCINETVIGTEIVVTAHRLCVKDVKRYIALDVAALVEKPPAGDEFRQKISRLLLKQSGSSMVDTPAGQTCYSI